MLLGSACSVPPAAVASRNRTGNGAKIKIENYYNLYGSGGTGGCGLLISPSTTTSIAADGRHGRRRSRREEADASLVPIPTRNRRRMAVFEILERYLGGARIRLAGSRFLLRPKWPRSFEIHNSTPTILKCIRSMYHVSLRATMVKDRRL